MPEGLVCDLWSSDKETVGGQISWNGESLGGEVLTSEFFLILDQSSNAPSMAGSYYTGLVRFGKIKTRQAKVTYILPKPKTTYCFIERLLELDFCRSVNHICQYMFVIAGSGWLSFQNDLLD